MISVHVDTRRQWSRPVSEGTLYQSVWEDLVSTSFQPATQPPYGTTMWVNGRLRRVPPYPIKRTLPTYPHGRVYGGVSSGDHLDVAEATQTISATTSASGSPVRRSGGDTVTGSPVAEGVTASGRPTLVSAVQPFWVGLQTSGGPSGNRRTGVETVPTSWVWRALRGMLGGAVPEVPYRDSRSVAAMGSAPAHR